jgi:3-deoxy-D-manno-octulosonic-acid transferase
MKPALVRAAYTALLRLLLPLYFARLWWRGRREPLYRRHWPERLGFGAERPPGGVWVHAVSLGETRAAAALIDALRQARPGLRIVLTHGTATGREAGRGLLAAGDHQAWLPYDTPGAVRRFHRRHQPAVGVLMETEIWPNLLHLAHEVGLPMVLANARLSDRSLAKGRRLGLLMRPAVAALTRTLAQTEADADRLRQSGVPKVQVSGNLKFDMTPAPALVDRGREWRRLLARPVVLAASTREGEEDMLLQSWAGLPLPRPLLLVVPRHPQRFDAVFASAVGRFGSVVRRSRWGDRPPAGCAAADVWIGDTLGEMPLYYGLADVALLGGSFARFGGQNLIEAAACGCPVLLGPHTYNFAAAADDAVAEGAAERSSDIDSAVRRAVVLCASAEREGLASAALAFADRHRGAAERMAGEVLALLARR